MLKKLETDMYTRQELLFISTELQSIRRDPACAEKRPVKVYLDMVAAPFETDDAEMEDSIRAAVRRSGYHSRRQPILRSLAVWKNRAVTMDHVPPEFSTLRDGSTFLDYQAPGFHIYYSLATIQTGAEQEFCASEIKKEELKLQKR
ncbi:hypothetical protein OSTOST_24666 [Ostertagia ostertagi]